MLSIFLIQCSSIPSFFIFFFFNDTATTEIYTLSLHDALPIFNNLLTIILANAQLVAKALPSGHADAHADLRDVMSAALRGRVMVKELLGFARRSRLELQSVHLGGLIDDLSGFLRRILPADVEIMASSEHDLPDVRADVHATEQILFNLVTNARDAMPDGGVLRIETSRVHLSEDQRQAWGSVRAGGEVR